MRQSPSLTLRNARSDADAERGDPISAADARLPGALDWHALAPSEVVGAGLLVFSMAEIEKMVIRHSGLAERLPLARPAIQPS